MKNMVIGATIVLMLLLLGCSQQQTSTPVRTVPVQQTMPVQQAVPPVQDTQQAPATAPAAPSSAAVDISGFAFSPGSVTISKGGSVTWKQKDSAPHTIVADDSSFESPELSNGQSWSNTFNDAGTFGYHCSIHPSMKAKVIVE